MIWTVLTAHRGATAPVRAPRMYDTARLRSSRYHHAALAKTAQQAINGERRFI